MARINPGLYICRCCVLLFLLVLPVSDSPAQASEQAVEDSIAQVRFQIDAVHKKTMTTITDLNKAWEEFRRDPTPASEARVNKLSADIGTLNNLSHDLWNWLETLKDQESTTLNTVRQILGEAQQSLDSAAELARGVIPGATYILGVSQETLFNDRWKDTEATFNALMEKGRELRKRHQEIKNNLQEKLKDTPENRAELKKLEGEIAVWKAKTQIMSEIYEFLRSDMPAEVVFWNELAGPYVQALYDNVKNNLEEIIIWDTLGGTSPAERLYKLFKPALQLKLGETFFSNPVITDKIRNILVMDVLFAGADLNRMQKSVELGAGKILDNDAVQGIAAELLGNPTRRAELKGILQQMSYDRIPAKAQAMLGDAVPAARGGTLERFVITGLSVDEIKRVQQVKGAKDIADSVMKVANEFIGPALNWSAFSKALEVTVQECSMYRAAYKQLRAADIVGAGTYVGIGGTVTTSAEDNYVNACFDDPSLFAAHLENLKKKYKGIDVAQYAIKETFRKKKVEPVNDPLPAPGSESEGGGDYGTWGNKLEKLSSDLWENAVAPESVPILIEEYQGRLGTIHGEKVSTIISRLDSNSPAQYECSEYAQWGWWGSGKYCTVKGAIDSEHDAFRAAGAKFDLAHGKLAGQEMPVLAKAIAAALKSSKIDKSYLTFPPEKVMEVAIEKDGVNIMLGADEANTWLWFGGWSGHNTPREVQEFLQGFLGEVAPLSLDNAATNLNARLLQMDKAIAGTSAFLSAKKSEKNAILALGGDLEKVAEHLAKRRNFFIAAQSLYGWRPANDEEWNASRVNVDDFIRRNDSFTAVFTPLFDAELARYQEVLNRFNERRPKIQKAADAAAAIPGLLTKLDTYAGYVGELGEGYYTSQKAGSSAISAVFNHGIATTQEGGIWLTLLIDELKPDRITTQQQLDFLLSPQADLKFPSISGIQPISHPVLQQFVTPEQTRLEKARSILAPAYLEVDGIINAYETTERNANDLQLEIDRLMAILRAGVREVAPAFAASITWDTLQMRKQVNGYSDWLNLKKPVAEFPRLPYSLWQDLVAQEKGVLAYKSFVRSIRLKPPVVQDQEVVQAVARLDVIFARVEKEGNSWVDYDPTRFSAALNEVNGDSYKIYESMFNKGKAPKDSPVANAYMKILVATSKINNIRVERDDLSEVVQALTQQIKETEEFLAVFSSGKITVTADQFSTWINTLQDQIKPGTKADSLKNKPAVSDLINRANSLIASLQAASADSGRASATAAIQSVRDLYAGFKRAYESRNESQIMSYLGDDWQAGDGTTLADLQATFNRMFRVFDEILFDMSSPTIQPTPQGFMVTYDVTITSRIFSRNIKHVEKSQVNELVAGGAQGVPKITQTLNGRFWYVE